MPLLTPSPFATPVGYSQRARSAVGFGDEYAIAQHLACSQSRLSGLERLLRLLDMNATGARHIAAVRHQSIKWSKAPPVNLTAGLSEFDFAIV